MTYKEATEEAIRLSDERNKKAKIIIEQAKQQGRWAPGLDSNNRLFEALNLEYQNKLKELWDSIDDWEGYTGDKTAGTNL